MIDPELDQNMAEICDELPGAVRRMYDGYVLAGFTIPSAIEFCMEFQRAYLLIKLEKDEE